MSIRSWIRRVAAVLAVLILIGVAILYWPEREDLSYLADAGAAYDVRILRDEWGVPHVFGKTDADTAYGLAYAHAEDDFLTIQQTLLAARGELASEYGRAAAPNDYMVALLRIWDVVDAEYDKLSPELRAISEAYAAGLNHYAALHEDEAIYGVFPVSGRDVIAGSVHKSPLFFGLDRTLGELFAEERQNTVSERTPQAVRPSRLAAGGGSGLASTQRFLLGLDGPDAFAAFGNGASAGSNTFAVSPRRSANGETFLAVNSHQPWTGPVAWYEAHVRSEEGWDMTGGLFPGMPLIGHGHNRNLGWAFTVNGADRTDVYVLEINPDNPYQYRFDGEWLELERREAAIRVRLIGRLRWTVSEETLWSVYGPVVRQDHGTYAVRYAAMGEAGLYEQLFRMNKARNLDEWLAAMEMLGVHTFNVGYADAEGNILYLYNGLVPIRDPHYDWQQYLPGNTSETLWTEYAALEDLPQVINPESGFVVNTNHTPFAATLDPENPSAGDFPAAWGIETDLNNRARRALTLFSEDDAITEEEFYTYKYDMVYSPDSEMATFIERLEQVDASNDALFFDALDVIRAWDRQVLPEARGAALAIGTYYRLGYADVDTLTDEEIVAAVIQTAEMLEEQHGRIDVAWAEVNRLQRGTVELGLGGGPDVLHAVYGDLLETGEFVGHSGDSFVMLITWDADGQVRSHSIHQFGAATARPDSPHYADQAALFVQRELKPVWMDETDIRAHLESEYRPGEERDQQR